MKAYPKYKESGISWLGAMPEHWSVGKIKFLCNAIFAGATPSTSRPEYWENGSIPWIPSGCCHDCDIDVAPKFITEAGLQNSSTKLIPANTTVMALTGATCAQLGYLTFESCANQSVVAFVENKDKANSRYLYYALLAAREEILSHKSGGAQGGINQEDCSNTILPFISLAEQEASAAYLDDKSAKIDECIKLLELQKTDILKFHDAVISETITLGLDRQVNLKDSGLRFVGMLPRDWEVKQIKNVATFHNGDRGVNYPSGNDLVDSGVPFLTSNNLHQLILDVDNAGCKFITRERYDILGGAKIQINDIVYCLRGSVGNCSLNKQLTEGTVASSLMVIRPTDIVPEYLNYLLHSDIIKNQTNVNMNGTCAANLSADNVSRYKIPVPPVSEQKDIVDTLNKKTAKIDEAIRRIDEQINDLRAYRTALISEVVTGKIDVRNT